MHYWGWTFTIIIIALVSKVTLLEWLSKFAQCWVPRESVLRGSGAHKATSTAQNLKVTLMEWHLKLTLLALHQVFTPNIRVHLKDQVMAWLYSNSFLCPGQLSKYTKTLCSFSWAIKSYLSKIFGFWRIFSALWRYVWC